MTPGLSHHFYPIPVEKCNGRGYLSYMHVPGAVIIAGDLLRYRSDTVARIPHP